MRIVDREKQAELMSKVTKTGRWPLQPWADSLFDGVALPRTITPRGWIAEGSVHRERLLSTQMDSNRYFLGPQVCILRDDNRRVTWAATVESPQGDLGPRQLFLHKFPGSWPVAKAPASPEHICLANGEIWRYHIALNKFNGEITTTWITRSNGEYKIWLNGEALKTEAQEPDFPFYAFSQPSIGHVVTEEPPFSIFGYKCRKTGQVFIRRMSSGKLGQEVKLTVDKVLGGITFAISGDKVLARVDLLSGDNIEPALIRSDDSGKTFGKAERINLSKYENGFKVVPGYTRPVVDVGGHFHAPIHVSNGKESAALNYVVRDDTLVEAIRVDGSNQLSNPHSKNQAFSQVTQEVFPATLGNPNAYGNGVSDGHGLIMVLSTEGQLFSSNSSAGGLYYPDSALLNYDMPFISAFASSECYTSGLKPNFVSMDYLYIETDSIGHPISSKLHLETWDMPLPVPKAIAKSKGSQVELTVVADADFEPGQVSFSFGDPSIGIINVKVTSLRSAVIDTNAKDLKGQTVRFDVDSLFHRHYGEAVIA